MKNKINIGQSVLDDCGNVQQAQKNEKQLTVDIDTIAEWEKWSDHSFRSFAGLFAKQIPGILFRFFYYKSVD